ncbi:MAG: hypothetical protein R3D59_10250 [Paracoccaceae bacterium]
MNNAYFDFLMWVRGPGFNIALVILVGGILLRLIEILVLGRKTDYAQPKGNGLAQGIKTIFTRSVAQGDDEGSARHLCRWPSIFHLGFFIAFLLLGAHTLIKSLIGFGWFDLNKALIDRPRRWP